ncbi:MAG: ribonuclease J, partial [Acholeplasmatales bacterium]|nr:ribonuclease J [Acholeplasmatales bacterium]
MSKINFIALGGVQEDGKNLYVIEVNNMIFVMDCGMKYPNQDSYGVDIIVNDLTYLSENKDRIQGLFLSHAHMDHIGGVIHLLKEKPDLRIYGSKYTMAVLGDILKDDQNVDYSKASLEVVTSKTALKFQDVTIRFFEVSHNLPESYGIALKSDDGYIIYTSNYNFDQNSHIDYAHMFRSLAVFAKEGVLALLTESLGANNEQSRGTILEFKTRIKNVFNQSNDRLIFSLFSSDILRIQQICDIAIGYGRKIAVIGRKTQKMVAQAINLGYLNIPEENFANLKFIDEKNGITNEDKNLVILVTGNRHEPFFMLQRMAKGVDRLIHLTKNDTVIVLTPPTLGTEKMASKTLDIIYHITSRVLEFNSTLLPQINANREEIKEMINILEPKYIIPVI